MGKLTTLAQGDANLTWQVRGGSIDFLGKAICVLNHAYLFLPSGNELVTYFSKF
jgi:hypothetical protein